MTTLQNLEAKAFEVEIAGCLIDNLLDINGNKILMTKKEIIERVTDYWDKVESFLEAEEKAFKELQKNS